MQICLTPAVSTVNSIRLAYSHESDDASAHGRYAHTDLVGSHQAVPVKSFARGGDPDASSPAQYAAKKIAEVARFPQSRSSEFCQPLSDCAARCICAPPSYQNWEETCSVIPSALSFDLCPFSRSN